GTPSLSLSKSGQPSVSSKPSLSSGHTGHLSSASGTPSLSLSVSGQPSMSSSSVGHASTESGMLSPSESRLFAGQPSFGYGSLPSSLSFGHLSARSSMPSR